MVDLLAAYRPRDDAEAADVARVIGLAETEPDPWSQALALHVTASALVVHPATGRLLLRWHARQQAWLQVGGHGDPGEREPLEVALREAQEETSLTDLAPWPDDALLHVVIVPVTARADSPAHHHADLRFALATDRPESAGAERQDAPVRWLLLDDAYAATSEDNLRETISRIAPLMDG